MKNQRWYDKEPTLSLAVSLIKDSDDATRLKCADLIIEIAQTNGVVLPNGIKDAVIYLMRRWYDKDEVLLEAMEYLKNSDENLRKEIALAVINLLRNI